MFYARCAIASKHGSSSGQGMLSVFDMKTFAKHIHNAKHAAKVTVVI